MHARVRLRFLLILVILATGPAFAHQTSDSFLALTLTNNKIEGRWAIAIRDLNHVLMFDNDIDGEISDSELDKAKPGIQSYSYNHLKLAVDRQRVDLNHKAFELQELDSAFYIVLLFDGTPSQGIPDIGIDYSLFFDADPAHRGLVRLDFPKRTETTILSPSHPNQRFFVEQPAAATGGSFANFVKEGVWHIWIGFDHILFLVALLLPSVLDRKPGGWNITKDLRTALLNIIKIVTAFTIAHSITLTLATLGWVRLPGRFIESVIAASVLLAAINNLKPIFPDRTWIIAFAFGLIHGFGFATVLAELNLPAASLGWALFGFNLGVELGQLAIVLAFGPIAFGCRKTLFYQQGALRFGSMLIAAISAVWFFQRAFNL